MLEASRKLEEQIRAERQQARDNQQAVRAVVQQNEQLAQELHATREALQQALQSASLVGSGITEEGSDIRESSSSDSDSSQHDGAEQDKSHAERQVGDDESRVPSTVSDLPPSLRHSVAAISGDALLTETSRAAKDGERRRLRSVEERLENERAARQRAESMVEDAEDETQTVQRLRQVETEQWVVELERVEAAAKTEIDRLAEEREEARETAMILEDDLQHERKHTIGALPTPRCICLWCLSVCLFVCLTAAPAH
jgi:chromosome segregation ATPase